MKPEAQRIAIAEACGWRKHMDRDVCHHWTSPNHGKLQFDFVPDYLNDLNAMREAETTRIEPYDIEIYTRELYMVVERFWTADRWVKFSRLAIDYALVHATAAQRAEAFLRTIGKWKDDDK